jgi:hypothetical protein
LTPQYDGSKAYFVSISNKYVRIGQKPKFMSIEGCPRVPEIKDTKQLGGEEM